MSAQPPKIEERSAVQISARLVSLLEHYTTHPNAPAEQYPFAPWRQYHPISRVPLGASAVLIGIFARFAEIVIERLNRVPEKNFLAFLDLLGAERQPAQPARAPLTFTLAAGSAVDARVPAGTQVAAPPPPAAKDPVVFETERPLVVTTAQLDSLVTLDPERDSYGDWSGRLATPSPFTVFQGDRALEHVLYLGDRQLLGYADIKDLRVTFTFAAPLASDAEPRQLRWECWRGNQWQPLPPVVDPTNNLAQPGTIRFGGLPPLPEDVVNARTSRWLRCRLLTPITQSPVPVAGMVRASQLRTLERIVIAVHLQRTLAAGLTPHLGYTNAAPLDLTKEFFPFGEKPRLHDTLFLASAEAFSKDRTANAASSSARVELDVRLANSHLGSGAGRVRPSSDLQLAWECWTGRAWQKVGLSAAPTWLALLELDPIPMLKTAGEVTSAILQGTAQSGAQVTSGTVPATAGAAAHPVAVGSDGRFADQVVLVTGVNVIEFTAGYLGRSSRAWAVVLNGTATDVILDVALPGLPVDMAAINLNVTVRGANAGQVTALRVTNGSTNDQPVQRAPGQAVPVVLAEGRNELLIEALGTAGGRLDAKTVMIARRAAAPAVDATGFSDGTFALCQSGVVTLRLPETTARTAVNGQESFWLRVRVVQGDYGKEASYALTNPMKPEDGFILVPASFRPPIVTAITIGYEITPERSPEHCFAYNQLAFEDCTTAAGADGAAFAPFVAVSEAQRPALHLGFSLPAGRAGFPNTTISLYSRVAAPRYGERAVPLSPEISRRAGAAGSITTHTFTITNAAAQPEDFDIAILGSQWPTTAVGSVHIEAGATYQLAVDVSIPVGKRAGDHDRGSVRLSRRSDPDTIDHAVIVTSVDVLPSAPTARLTWQYWNGARWSKLPVQDDSHDFTRSGLVEFLAPADFARRKLFGRERYWLRAAWDEGDYAVPPRLHHVLTNTTLARQTITIVNEILGSSNGSEGQRFRSTRAPVLDGQRLEVREPEMPSAEEQAILEDEEGNDAIPDLPDVPAARGRPREIWVRWHAVPDFYGSNPRDRHYVINHLAGEIRFGDGVNGQVPPRGTSNLRLGRYQTGGGTVGNNAAGMVTQLKTTVPYIDKVTNLEPATGGAEAETEDTLIARMPRTLRHRDRAVTLEDYEDLALLASSEVARTRCVPMRDLVADPLGTTPHPGAVSVIVVPRTRDAKPLPMLELLARVRDFLGDRAPATALLAVVGPLYVRVNVTAEIAVTSPGAAGAVERDVHERLALFLHPLTGGLDGSGWDFGRTPHRSDFFALIESVAGVDHVRYLRITEVEDQPGVRQTGRFVVFSGEHQISLVVDEP